MKKNILSFIVAVVGLFVAIGASSQTPAFPGAEGGGKYVTGGRGGIVYFVNTLDDNNTGNPATREGSLRWCLGRSGTRTIVFKVGGVIKLNSRLNITNGNVTIAGQTAPGNGICIRDYEVNVNADNVIIRYMRFRLGDEITAHEPDAIWGRYRTGVIIDHCSISWSIDECASFYSNNNFTMQWCFITESLNSSLHGKGTHGYGGLWGGKNASFHHNLLAHHNSRNPRFNGWKRSGLNYENPQDEERVDYRNNVIYNWGDNSAYGGEAAGKYNIVANYYKPGAQSKNRSRIVNVDIDAGAMITPRFGQFYIAENYMHGNASVTANNWLGVTRSSGVTEAACKADSPFEHVVIPQHTAEKAYEKVLAYGGASLNRDAVDVRIADEVLNGTYTYVGSKTGYKGIIDSQEDLKPADANSDWSAWDGYTGGTSPQDSNADGIPDGWIENNYPGKTANQLNEEGYTYLEVYLNSLVADITHNQYQEAVVQTRMEELAISDSNIVTTFVGNGGNTLFVRSDYTIEKISVWHVTGKMLINKSVKNQSGEIDLSLLPQGVYAVKVVLESNRNVSAKIIK